MTRLNIYISILLLSIGLLSFYFIPSSEPRISATELSNESLVADNSTNTKNLEAQNSNAKISTTPNSNKNTNEFNDSQNQNIIYTSGLASLMSEAISNSSYKMIKNQNSANWGCETAIPRYLNLSNSKQKQKQDFEKFKKQKLTELMLAKNYFLQNCPLYTKTLPSILQAFWHVCKNTKEQRSCESAALLQLVYFFDKTQFAQNDFSKLSSLEKYSMAQAYALKLRDNNNTYVDQPLSYLQVRSLLDSLLNEQLAKNQIHIESQKLSFIIEMNRDLQAFTNNKEVLVFLNKHSEIFKVDPQFESLYLYLQSANLKFPTDKIAFLKSYIKKFPASAMAYYHKAWHTWDTSYKASLIQADLTQALKLLPDYPQFQESASKIENQEKRAFNFKFTFSFKL